MEFGKDVLIGAALIITWLIMAVMAWMVFYGAEKSDREMRREKNVE